MTSIVALKVSNEYGEGIVLGSDTQLNKEDREGIFTEKVKFYQKIIYGDRWALAHAGDVDNPFDIFNDILEGRKKSYVSLENANIENLIDEAISNYKLNKRKRITEKKKSYRDFFKKPDFELVNLLNSYSMKNYKLEDDQDEGDIEEVGLHTFLLAKANPDLGLWIIDTYGNLREVEEFGKELNYLCIGSGSNHIKHYIDNLLGNDKINPHKLDIPQAIEIVMDSLEKAKKDPHSGGPSPLAVITSEVYYDGNEIIKEYKKINVRRKEFLKKKYST